MRTAKSLVLLTGILLVASPAIRLEAAETNAALAEITARIRREQRQEELNAMTPGQQAAWQKLRRERVDRRVQELRRKKALGTLTTEEKQHLAELEEFQRIHTKLNLQPVIVPKAPATNELKTVESPRSKSLRN